MTEKIKKLIAENNLFAHGSRVCVAFSGGADSSALLDFICSIAEEWQLTVSAAHYNHMLRGAESDRDERFCREVCRKRGITFYCGRGDVAEHARLNGLSTEQAARELRYEFLNEFAAEYGLTVLTAHNADDNLETVILALLRSKGAGGLAGIAPKNGVFARPLLNCTKDEVLQYCRERGVEYVTDSTNLTDCCARNLLRHEVIPVLKQINPKVSECALRSSELLRGDDAFLCDTAHAALTAATLSADEFNCRELAKLPDPLLSRVMMELFSRYGATATRAGIIAAINLTRSSGGHTDACGLRLNCCRGILSVGESVDGFEPVLLHEGENSFANRRIVMEICEQSAQKGKIYFKSSLNYDKIIGHIVARSRRAGDYFKPVNRCGKPLKKLFNESGIPLARRAATAVLCDDEGIVFVEGFGPDSRVAPDGVGRTAVINITDKE